MTETIKMTGKQLAALAKIGEPGADSLNRTIMLEQTETDAGGTHLYARVLSKYVHISMKGNVTELEA